MVDMDHSGLTASIPGGDAATVTLTAHDVARQLNGCEYGEEGSRELWAAMKVAGLVAVFGASDDLVELRGAIDDEIGYYGGGPFYVTPTGLFQDCECRCVWARGAKDGARKIEAVWDDGDVSWSYKTDIPHASFDVMEDGEVYCEGIVFALADVAPKSGAPA